MNYYFFFYQDSLLLTEAGRVPCGEDIPSCITEKVKLRLLAAETDRYYYAAALEAPIEADGWQMQSLRATFYHLPHPIYRMAGKAREILYWDAQTQYCGVCGTRLIPHTNISKRCPQCGKTVWPALKAAIIVAITRNEGREILLVQSNQFKRDYLSLVAGFVETGENLEECVRREVREETQLEIKNLRYFASQAWPYPSGLMLGFTAEYAAGTLRLQHSELNKGGWYTRDALPNIPGPVSIARRLIDAWREE